jgi:hypothetical protein
VVGDASEIFIVGSPRSGTTLMARVLNEFPDVWIGNETGFVPHLFRPGSEPGPDWDDRRLAELLDAVNSYLRTESWPSLASVDGVRRFWSTTGTRDYAALIRYVWSLDGAVGAKGAVVVGDQTPAYVLAMPLLEQLFPRARFVHIVRDPRDVVASVVPLRFWSKSVGVAAADWNECIAGWWAAERRIPPERRIEVRYEDLVSDPQSTRERLAGFLHTSVPAGGLAGEPLTYPSRVAPLPPHHRRLAEPIDDSSVGRHRSDLSKRERGIVEAITYAGLRTYGYEVGPYRPSPVLREDAALLTRWRVQDLQRRVFGAVTRRWQD